MRACVHACACACVCVRVHRLSLHVVAMGLGFQFVFIVFWKGGGAVACVWLVEGGSASSTQHHQGDGPASSLGCVSMGTEQCAMAIALVV